MHLLCSMMRQAGRPASQTEFNFCDAHYSHRSALLRRKNVKNA